MSNPLFSTYRQGENRVTATILAVFERLSFAIVEQILQSLLEEPETKLVTFQNQPSGPSSVPDARIFASFSYWIETKTVPDAIRPRQLRNHLLAFDDQRYGAAATQRLLVLTPEPVRPVAIDELEDDRVAWSNFDNLVTAIEEAMRDDKDWLKTNRPLPTESERELLRELVHFLILEKLVGQNQARVLIVAARRAYAEYLRYGLYFCQPNRSFQLSSHIGFYCDGAIQPEFPRIYNTVEEIQLSEEGVQSHTDLSDAERERLLTVIAKLRSDGATRYGEYEKVFFLSGPSDEATLQLSQVIRNDLTSEGGRTIAFTQGQRYTTLEALRQNPSTTTELLRWLTER